jgi:hypothetical protein
METTTRFDLNHSIRQWRESFVQSAAMRIEELDELEFHLRDSIVHLRERQLNEEESFLIATRRLGNPEVLTGEFAKANPGRVWQSRLRWMLMGVFLFQIPGSLPNVGSALLWRLAPGGISGHWLGFLAVAARWMALIAPLAGFLWLTTRRPQLLAQWMKRASEHPAITALSLVLAALLALAISTIPTLLLVARLGVPATAEVTRMQTMSWWQMIGYSLLEVVLLPVALVWLARGAQARAIAK